MATAQIDMFGLTDDDAAAGDRRCPSGPGRYPWWHAEQQTATPPNLYLFSAGIPVRIERFGSGASAFWDFLGYALVGMPVGVTATEVTVKVRAKIVSYVDRGGRVFVDSGAFGAFRAGKEMDFEELVFPVYDELCRRARRRQGLLLVMPDCVGDQRRTLELQQLHIERIHRWIDSGAEAVFPLQDANVAPLHAYERLLALLDDRPHTLGIPSNARAWRPHQVVDFVRRARPDRVHLLGLARDSVLQQLARDIGEHSPATRLSCDACALTAHAGRGRRLTDRAKSRLESAVAAAEQGDYGDVLPDLSTYLTDVLYTPGFLSDEQVECVAHHLGYRDSAWRSRFIAAAAGQGLREVLAPLDPDETWMPQAMASVVAERLYRPWLRRVLAGPIRAWEVARIACDDDPQGVPGLPRLEETIAAQEATA